MNTFISVILDAAHGRQGPRGALAVPRDLRAGHEARSSRSPLGGILDGGYGTMQTPDAGELTPKGRATRARIVDAALRLFAERGYEAATMRDMAEAADCSLGLAYRYFSGKDALVLELYRRLADELADGVASQPPGPLAVRFGHAMQTLLARMAPYRGTLGALFGAALRPRATTSIFGADAAAVRDRSWRAHRVLVVDASERRLKGLADDLATILYGLQLGLVFFWLEDESANAARTGDFLRLMCDMLRLAPTALRLPPAVGLVRRLARLLAPLLGPQDLLERTDN
jgi:AcrR family transcriptional regulator